MNNYTVINLSAYTSPEIKEMKQKDWVEYRLNDRDYDYPTGYYDYLIDRAKYSVTNGGAIGGFCRFIYGEGLDAVNGSTRPQQYIEFKKLVRPHDLKKAIEDRKKLMMCAFQVTKERGEITKISHFPIKTLLPEKMNDDGEIEAWYYHPNWKEKKNSEEPLRIPAWGFGSDSGNEIYVIKAYNAGSDYFGSDDGYTGALAYAVLEEQIADFQVNDAMNGFVPSTIINFNNGVPDEETRRKVERDIYRKTTGASGKKVIVAFNDDETKATTVEKVAMDNAPEHYSYLSEECVNKILAGHRAPAEVLGFNNSPGGFANNAEELKNKLKAFIHFEVQPYQLEFIEALEEILAVNGIGLELFFRDIEPSDYTEAPTQLDKHEKNDFTDEEGDVMLEALQGEIINTDEWVLCDTKQWTEEAEANIEEWVSKHVKIKKTLADRLGLSRVIKSSPSEESRLDASVYKVRFTYREKYSSANSRMFCRKMMARTGRGVVYRIEDIDQASFQGVNRSFGHRGQNYSLLRHKGGVNCGHYWQMELYRLKKKTDGTYYEDRALSSSEEVDSIPKSYIPKGEKYNDAATAPKDMPNNGHHPNFRG